MSVLSFMAANSVKTPSGFWPWLLRLFSFIPDYAWRIIIFTILLKLVLSPLDFYQKYIMKKNARITQKIKPEIEKLQKQYGDDKMGLQRAQMGLQKAAGVKTFASCIPMILTMIIFLTFYTGMRKVSAYTEFEQYVHRYEVYSARYYELTGIEFTAGITPDSEILDGLRSSEGYEENFDRIIISLLDKDGLTAEQQAAWDFYKDNNKSFQDVYAAYLKLDEETKFFSDTRLFALTPSSGLTYTEIDVKKSNGEYDLIKIHGLKGSLSPELVQAEADVVKLVNEKFAKAVKDIEEENAKKENDEDKYKIPDTYKSAFAFTGFEDLYSHYYKFEEFNSVKKNFDVLKSIAEDEASQTVKMDYLQNDSGFLWIKSIWRPDSPISWKFPFTFRKLEVVSNYNDFSTRVNASSTNYMEKNAGNLDPAVYAAIKGETNYNKIMGAIRADENLSKVNGYFILAILAIALSVLSQFITTRQQKRSGQMAAAGGAAGPMNMKLLMFIMPVMIGIFALSSTSAFTLYMITNSAMSLLINLLTTLILGFIGKTKDKQEFGQAGVVKYGRKDPNDFIKK